MELIKGRMRLADKADLLLEKLENTGLVNHEKDDDTRRKNRNMVMDAIEEIEGMEEETRTLTEVHEIVDCVRNGIPIQVAYYNPDEDMDDEGMVYKALW